MNRLNINVYLQLSANCRCTDFTVSTVFSALTILYNTVCFRFPKVLWPARDQAVKKEWPLHPNHCRAWGWCCVAGRFWKWVSVWAGGFVWRWRFFVFRKTCTWHAHANNNNNHYYYYYLGRGMSKIGACIVKLLSLSCIPLQTSFPYSAQLWTPEISMYSDGLIFWPQNNIIIRSSV